MARTVSCVRRLQFCAVHEEAEQEANSVSCSAGQTPKLRKLTPEFRNS
jgi:hypothetical protein